MVEERQAKLAKNGEDMERWLSRLLRAANELRYLRDQRKRLLKLPSKKVLRDRAYRARKKDGQAPITL